MSPLVKPNPDHKQVGPWNLDAKSRLVIACDRRGRGAVAFAVGPVEEEIEQIGSHDLGDLGLDDAPPGLSIWEGRVHGWERNTPDGHEYDSELRGTFRRPTAEELLLLADGKEPWRPRVLRRGREGRMKNMKIPDLFVICNSCGKEEPGRDGPDATPPGWARFVLRAWPDSANYVGGPVVVHFCDLCVSEAISSNRKDV